MEDETITLCIGNFANYVGTHLKNVQQDLDLSDDSLINDNVNSTMYDGSRVNRCVMIDLFENIGNYPSEVKSSQHAEWNGKVAKSDVVHSCVESWTDLMQCELHPKSLVQLPKWVTSKNFDTYHKGQNDDFVTDELVEDVMDRLRYFAEGCNHVSAIQCYFDLQQGFGGLSAKILESIKDDIGAVCLPVCGFTETKAYPVSHDIIDHVKSLNLPLSYYNVLEHASLFIPMETHQSISALLKSQSNKVEVNQASLITALTLEVSTLFDIRAGRKHSERLSSSVFDWIHSVSCGGRFKMATIEAYISELYDSNYSSRNQELENLVKRFDSSSNNNGVSGVNPFMHSLSSVDFGAYSSSYANVFTSIQQSDNRSLFSVPYSNVVHAVGGYPSDWLATLQSRTKHTSYRITQSVTCSSPVYLPTPQFVSVCGPLSESRLRMQQQYQNLNTMTAVGTHERIGGYMRRVSVGWSEEAEISKVQLQKVGVTADDVSEITEQLLSYSQTYIGGSGNL